MDAASFAVPVVPGSLVSIFGSNLAAPTAEAGAIPLSLGLGGVSVLFNGLSAPLMSLPVRSTRSYRGRSWEPVQSA